VSTSSSHHAPSAQSFFPCCRLGRVGPVRSPLWPGAELPAGRLRTASRGQQGAGGRAEGGSVLPGSGPGPTLPERHAGRWADTDRVSLMVPRGLGSKVNIENFHFHLGHLMLLSKATYKEYIC